MKLQKTGLRKGLAVGAVSAVAFGLASAVGAAPAAASVSLTYTCPYPLIGNRQFTATIDTNAPAKIGENQNTGKIQVFFKARLGADTTSGLNAVDAAFIEGNAAAGVTVTKPDGNLNVTVQNALKRTAIPASGAFDLEGYGEVPSGFASAAQGKYSALLKDFDLKINLFKKDGSPSALGTFASHCTQNPGQNNVVGSGDVVADEQPEAEQKPVPDFFPYKGADHNSGSLHYDFNLSGESVIKMANGKVPLTGKIGVDVDGKSGVIGGKLKLDQTKGNMAILGFLPVVATVGFQPVANAQGDDTIGTYTNGEIKTTSNMFITFPSFNLLGIPIGGGANCKTTQPSAIDMFSTPGQFFDPKAGGPYKSTGYTISSIADCGPLTGIIGIFAAGSGNTIDMTLAPPK